MDETEQTQTADLPVDAILQVLQALRPLDRDARRRVVAAVLALIGDEASSPGALPGVPAAPDRTPSKPLFAQDRSPSPKEFLLEKRPKTEVDRVGCLAFYLTHYRDQPAFKTVDLSMVNSEAAQPKFSNAAQAVDNAAKSGILLPVGQGQKQLSAAGELYVQALPDTDAARLALREHRHPKRRT